MMAFALTRFVLVFVFDEFLVHSFVVPVGSENRTDNGHKKESRNNDKLDNSATDAGQHQKLQEGRVGIEPTTRKLTVCCSTTELPTLACQPHYTIYWPGCKSEYDANSSCGTDNCFDDPPKNNSHTADTQAKEPCLKRLEFFNNPFLVHITSV